jgi:hypothetical protein
MHVIKQIQTYQAHPVPDRVVRPRGPFPAELFKEPEIVYEYEQAYGEDGENFSPGSTSQNNFKALKWLRCKSCHERVREDETEMHECED